MSLFYLNKKVRALHKETFNLINKEKKRYKKCNIYMFIKFVVLVLMYIIVF